MNRLSIEARSRNEHSSTAPFFLPGYTCDMVVKRPFLTLIGVWLAVGTGVMALAGWGLFDVPTWAQQIGDLRRGGSQTAETLEALVERAEARDQELRT